MSLVLGRHWFLTTRCCHYRFFLCGLRGRSRISIQFLNWKYHMEKDVWIFKMVHRELWQIRSFFVGRFLDYDDISPLFPPELTTEAPMMQSFTLQSWDLCPRGLLGCIHCPQLRTLTLWSCDKALKSLIPKPMQNLRVLTIINCYSGLTWQRDLSELSPHDEIPRVALPSFKTLAFLGCHEEMVYFLRHLYVPSLEHMEFGCFDRFHSNVHRGSLNTVLDVICGEGAVQLRRLTLGKGALRGANFHAMWPHLKHLETLAIEDPDSKLSADGLFIALSPRDHDFSSVCPQLKTLELSCLEISMGALVDFVQRRVKSNLGDPAPGLVTCLKMSNMCGVDMNRWVDKVWVDEEVSAQLAETHGSSVHLVA